MFPPEFNSYLDKGGVFALLLALYWAVSTGRLYLKREVDFIIEQLQRQLADKDARLLKAEAELDQQRALMNKVVDHALSEKKDGA